MEAIKKLIRFSQIQRIRAKQLDLYEFQKFYDQGEKAWIEENLNPDQYFRFWAEDRYKSKSRFQTIQHIRQKPLYFDVF